MRAIFCALLLAGSLFAQQEPTADSSNHKGSFYVDGIVYEYAASSEYTMVAAAHSVINRKFAAVKIRVYNGGSHSITFRPEDIVIEDAVGGRTLTPVSATELANKMRKTYNMARYAVSSGPIGDGSSTGPITSDMMSPQFLQMMRAMAAHTNSGAAVAGNNLLYTDTPGALEDGAGPRPAPCDEVCHLRSIEAQSADALAQLQRQNSPDFVEQAALRANTLPPHANEAGVLYIPLGKLSQESPQSAHMKRRRIVRVTVPLDEEKFQFVLLVE
jgi:hypothetical protein